MVADEGGDYGGYRDHGGEIWDEDDAFAEGTSTAAKRAAKRRSTATATTGAGKKVAPKKRVNSLFTGAGRASKLGAAVVRMGDEDGGVAGGEEYAAFDLLCCVSLSVQTPPATRPQYHS